MTTKYIVPIAAEGNALTMTSLEMAGLAEKRHDHVLRDIKKMLVDLYGVRGQSFEQMVGDSPNLGDQAKSIAWDIDARGYVSCFRLDKEHAITLVAGYDARLRKRIVDRWMDLERALHAPAGQGLTKYDAAVIGNIVKNCTGVVVREQLAEMLTEHKRVQDGQNRALAVVEEQMKALMALVHPGIPGVYRPGKTAGAILRAAGFAHCPTRLALWFGNRLEAAGCRVEGRIDTGTSHSRLFDPDKAEVYLKNGGAAAVEKKIAERRGQGVLALSRRSIEPYMPQDMAEGTGAIILDGKIVMYDSNDITLSDGDRAVIVMSNGEVCIDVPEHQGDSGYQGYRFDARAAMSSTRTEERVGRSSTKVRHGCIILGKVTEVRVARPRPVLVASNQIGA